MFFILILFISSYAFGQESPFETDHTHYLEILGSAKDSLYQKILTEYDEYIQNHPTDPKPQLERCRFIEYAYYDEYEDYSPNYDEAETCAQEVLTSFPDDPEVLLYAGEFLYGDTSLAYLEKLEDIVGNDPEEWRGYSWMVYQQLAEHYEAEENHEEVIRYAQMTLEENDTLDLTLMIGKAHKNLSQNTQAIDVLVRSLDSTQHSWILNQKGRLLLELGVPEKALEAFRLAKRDTSAYEDSEALAQAMIDNGLALEARQYLLKNYTSNTWNNTSPLQKLLEYDLVYAADSAGLTYDRFVEKTFWNDPFALYRLRLLVANPFHHWSLADVGRLLMLLLLFAGILVVPYLWILPIHYLGRYQEEKGGIFQGTSFRWGLKHFWLASSLWLMCDIAALLLFDYSGIISLFNGDMTLQEVAAVSRINANLMLSFALGCFMCSLVFLRKEDITTFLRQLNGAGTHIGTGIGLAFGLRFGLGIYMFVLKTFGIDFASATVGMATITDSIVSINKFYSPFLGFLLVVILVPFYEEVLFRGVFLSACQRNMKFIYANLLQSLVFALLHQELKLLPFYIAFGMVAGHFRQQTQSLLVGTSMHITNNLIAFVAISLLRF